MTLVTSKKKGPTKHEITQVEDFSIKDSEVPLPPLDDGSLPLENYALPCPYCGRMKIIAKESVERKRKGKTKRYQCTNCGRKFVDDVVYRSHYPLWVHGRVLDLAATTTMKLTQIVKEIKRESKLRGQEISITPQAIPYLIERDVSLLLEFERLVPKKKFSGTWQIDDMYQAFSEESGARRCTWVTNVMSEEKKYWLSCQAPMPIRIKAPRDEERVRSGIESRDAFLQAIARGFHIPSLVKSDDYSGHAMGARMALPGVPIISKSKEEDLGHISLIERLHNFIRETIERRRWYAEIPFRKKS